jgi:hypothetical protein
MLGETALVTALLGAVLAAQLTFSRTLSLLRRRFWLDEIVTEKLVSDPDLAHSLRAIANGLDTNPPAYHLLLRAFRRLVPGPAEVTLRMFSLLWVVAGLVGLYLYLRLAYAPAPAFAAVLAVWGHPLVLRYAVEARMYGPWLAAVIWFAYAFHLSWSCTEVGAGFLLGATALLTCFLHTLGPMALGLVVAAHLLAYPASAWHWPSIALAAVGPLGFLAWVPLLRKQNAAYPITWAPPLTVDLAVGFLRKIFLPGHLGVLLLAGVLLPWMLGVAGPGPTSALRDPSALAGLVGLALLPFFLILLSCPFQSIIVPRYALPAVVALAPACAEAVAHLQTPWVAAICAGLFVLGGHDLRWLDVDYSEQRTTNLIEAIRKYAAWERVLFEYPHELYAVCRYAPDLADRCYGVEFEQGQPSPAALFRDGCRYFMRVFAKFYPVPPLLPWKAVSGLKRLYLVLPAWQNRKGFGTADEQFPGFTARHIEAGLYELVAARQLKAEGDQRGNGT